MFSNYQGVDFLRFYAIIVKNIELFDIFDNYLEECRLNYFLGKIGGLLWIRKIK